MEKERNAYFDHPQGKWRVDLGETAEKRISIYRKAAKLGKRK